MIGVIVAAHGTIGEALVRTALRVLPSATIVLSVGLDEQDTSETFEAKLHEAMHEVARELNDGASAGIILLTDMFGGTPSNVALTCHHTGKVEVVTGVNLPMLLKTLEIDKTTSLSAAATLISEAGHRAIISASTVLGSH